jgi:hypothetical protein
MNPRARLFRTGFELMDPFVVITVKYVLISLLLPAVQNNE